MWHATAVPVEIMRVLLGSLASTDSAGIAAGSMVSEETIAEATRPLADARWGHTVDGRWIHWQAVEDHPAGVQFDAFTAHSHHSALPAWTFWGGGACTLRWALHFSTYAPASVLQDVALEVAQEPVTARTRRMNTLSRTDIRAQPTRRASPARGR
ncbi:hypothetical protein GCM10009837_41810 [Streptomyces durmitorensis]